MKVTKRDVKVFALGMLAAFLILFFTDFQNNIDDFKAGFSGKP